VTSTVSPPAASRMYSLSLFLRSLMPTDLMPRKVATGGYFVNLAKNGFSSGLVGSAAIKGVIRRSARALGSLEKVAFRRNVANGNSGAVSTPRRPHVVSGALLRSRLTSRSRCPAV
jgi:hypothetical protein